MADQQKEEFKWTGKHQKAFDLVKTHLTSALVLGYPDVICPFDLRTDVSLQGLGAIIFQWDKNGKGAY